MKIEIDTDNEFIKINGEIVSNSIIDISLIKGLLINNGFEGNVLQSQREMILTIKYPINNVLSMGTIKS